MVDKCICKSCPSFVDCGEEIAYCLTKKSKCIKKEKGCICGGCPISVKNKFRHGYFCTKGNEKQQNGTK